MAYCYVCPHRCGIDRPESINDEGIFGSCGCGMLPIVARAALHMWEEPCISGTNGSGTVFFSGCNLHCAFCQNYEISCLNKGTEITIERLRAIYFDLIEQGAHNINLVTPTHFTEAVLSSLQEPLPVPVVYNTSGFETLDTVRKLKDKVQIWLPDLKYSDDLAAIKYSNAPNYFATATAAIKAMYKQVGPYKIDDSGLLQRGVVIRHLLLPNMVDNTLKIIDWVAANFEPGQVLFSLMHQYVPCGRAAEYPEIDRTVTVGEHRPGRKISFCFRDRRRLRSGRRRASTDFIPCFDGTGV